MENELSYWLALAHTPQVRTKTKNEIIVRLHEQGKSMVDFFHADPASWCRDFDISESDAELFKQSASELSNYAFLVEDLLEQGYHILPITSTDYSPTLKKNLGKSYAPPVLYAKGNLQIMKEKSVAIVGSRKANSHSLQFTDQVAKKATAQFEVVVSGFAKGVDKQALDSAINYKGQSIIVLPQGITTFDSGYKKYYKQIIEGDVLVLSVFHPKAPWSVPLAMARNPIIYGLATDIYVAESSDQGGTWSGVIDGLRKGRTIYVRQPNPREKNANALLIAKGAKAVDHLGNLTEYIVEEDQSASVSDPLIVADSIEERIIELLRDGTYDSKTIVDKLGIDWSGRKVTSFLKNHAEVETVKGKPLKFTLKGRMSATQTTLF